MVNLVQNVNEFKVENCFSVELFSQGMDWNRSEQYLESTSLQTCTTTSQLKSPIIPIYQNRSQPLLWAISLADI